MSILFINGSPNKNGNTAKLAETLMSGKAYQTLNLVDYKVYGYGQNFADDQFTEIVEQMKAADTIVIGSPVYWHNMSGMVRNLIARCRLAPCREESLCFCSRALRRKAGCWKKPNTP